MARQYPRYLTPHPSAKHQVAWKYQRFVPKKFRGALGKDNITAYIPMMRMRDAAKRAAAYTVRDNRLFDHLGRLSAEELAAIGARGGLDALQDQSEFLTRWAPTVHEASALVNGIAQLSASEFATALAHGVTKDALTTSGMVGLTLAHQTVQELVRSRPMLLKASPSSDMHSLDGLLALWTDWKGAKHTRKHKASVGLLKDFLGDVDIRGVTADDIAHWRDDLASRGKTVGQQEEHLSQISALFRAAVSNIHKTGCGSNPCQGIKVGNQGRESESEKPKSFTPAEMRAILARAEAICWGGRKRHEAGMWLLRVQAETGCRPNEAAQLQSGDVYVKDGVQVIHFRQECAVTGKRHLQKSMKNAKPEKNRRGDRRVPIPSAISKFFDYATKGRDKGEFVFAAFKWYGPEKGRWGWLGSNFRALTDTGLTGYAFRHAYIDAMRNAGIPLDIQWYLTDHDAGQHGDYGDGTHLQLLAKLVEKIRPLDDVVGLPLRAELTASSGHPGLRFPRST